MGGWYTLNVLIKTNSFELAAITKGDPESEKVAIALPGRLDTKDYWNFGSHLEVLANKGFYALAIDPPGTWESPGGIELFTTTNYIQAVNELIEQLGGKPTLLFGHSRGGATAALVAAQNSHVIGLVTVNESLGAPSSPDPKTISSGFYTDHRDLPPGDHKTVKQKELRVPLAYFADGRKYDDSESLKRVRVPKLLFYSEDDEFTSTNEFEKIFVSLPEPKVSYKLSGTHDYRYYPEAVEEVNLKVSSFINDYIKH